MDKPVTASLCRSLSAYATNGRAVRSVALSLNVIVACLLFYGTGLIAQAPEHRVARVPSPPNAAASQAGSYYALVIGIDEYRAPLPNLKTAVNDAQAVAQVLSQRYGFQVRLLLNGDATRDNILDAMEQYRANLTANDSLLIYYAGHGSYDDEAKTAYWLPADANPSLRGHWISTDDLNNNMRGQPARHVLVISDSCYSGGLGRGATAYVRPSNQQELLRKSFAGKSRDLLASGGLEPVADGGRNGHSVFAGAVLRALNESERSEFTGRQLFEASADEVAGSSRQLPDYSPIRNSNHESGDFVFSRGGNLAKGLIESAAKTAGSGREKDSKPFAPRLEPASTLAADPDSFARLSVVTDYPNWGGLNFGVVVSPTQPAYDTNVTATFVSGDQATPIVQVLKIPPAESINSYNKPVSPKIGNEVAVCYTGRLGSHADKLRLTQIFKLDGKAFVPEREPVLESSSDAPCGDGPILAAIHRQEQLAQAQERAAEQAEADLKALNQKEELARKEALTLLPRANSHDGLKYVWIPPGHFDVGCSPPAWHCTALEEPSHRVTITKGFWMGQTPVTVAAWKRYRSATGAPKLPTADWAGRSGWNEAGEETRPIVDMTWDQADGYCRWSGMRLPTESEWELAARAGDDSENYGDRDNSRVFDVGTRPVGQRSQNPLRLYDMLGNVLAWTADYVSNPWPQPKGVDPTGAPPNGGNHIVRGNNLQADHNVGLTDREPSSWLTSGHAPNVGFRCVGNF